jgi:hypothetical protein
MGERYAPSVSAEQSEHDVSRVTRAATNGSKPLRPAELGSVLEVGLEQRQELSGEVALERPQDLELPLTGLPEGRVSRGVTRRA